jgi:CubicO group peptidase (beta-lactamase class C family)
VWSAVPATSRTLYRLGSISKSITATAAMELWEHGKLNLDSPVQELILHEGGTDVHANRIK